MKKNLKHNCANHIVMCTLIFFEMLSVKIHQFLAAKCKQASIVFLAYFFRYVRLDWFYNSVKIVFSIFRRKNIGSVRNCHHSFCFGECLGCESMNTKNRWGVQCECVTVKRTQIDRHVRSNTIRQSWVHVYECKMSRLHGMLYVLDVWWRRQVFNACYTHTIHTPYTFATWNLTSLHNYVGICFHVLRRWRRQDECRVEISRMRHEKCKQNNNIKHTLSHKQHQCQANRITLC